MRKINYRITVNITQKTMKLGFRAKMPDEMQGKRIRVQAVFTQRPDSRRCRDIAAVCILQSATT